MGANAPRSWVQKIRGSGFHAGATVTYSGTGITVIAVTVNSSTLISATLNVASNATIGAHDVTVTNTDTSSITCVGCFTVDVGPVITSLSPASLARGATGAHITVTGAYFSNGAVVVRAVFSGTGVTVTQVAWVDANHIKLTVTVAASATTGKRALTVINNDGGRTTKQGVLTIT